MLKKDNKINGKVNEVCSACVALMWGVVETALTPSLQLLA